MRPWMERRCSRRCRTTSSDIDLVNLGIRPGYLEILAKACLDRASVVAAFILMNLASKIFGPLFTIISSMVFRGLARTSCLSERYEIFVDDSMSLK